jgi:hypothetical protein
MHLQCRFYILHAFYTPTPFPADIIAKQGAKLLQVTNAEKGAITMVMACYNTLGILRLLKARERIRIFFYWMPPGMLVELSQTGYISWFSSSLDSIHGCCGPVCLLLQGHHFDVNNDDALYFTKANKTHLVFWDITPCNPLKVNERFRGTCRLHFQGKRISQIINDYEEDSKQRKL